MIIISDVHGNYNKLNTILKKNPDKLHIQLGDLGIGFRNNQKLKYTDNFKFIRGNHDHPELSRNHPAYLRDFGKLSIEDKKVFFVSGAYSIDKNWRIPGVSWWEDEELSILELEKAIEEYIEFKPDVMLTHDGPYQATKYLLNFFDQTIPSRTAQALDAMFEAYQPKIWIFGHWHQNFEKVINGTKFICLEELGTYELESL